VHWLYHFGWVVPFMERDMMGDIAELILTLGLLTLGVGLFAVTVFLSVR
jgi:hypothetical protein